MSSKKLNLSQVWLLPCNPKKIFDIEKVCREAGKTDWHCCKNIQAGDTVFICVSEGVHKVRYRCKVEEVFKLDEKPFLEEKKYFTDEEQWRLYEEKPCSYKTRAQLALQKLIEDIPFRKLREHNLVGNI